MKRSYENVNPDVSPTNPCDTEELENQREIKRHLLDENDIENEDFSTSNTGQGSLEETASINYSIDVDEPLTIDNPEDVEELDWTRRDVIRSSLAMIRRSNIFDWDIDIFSDSPWMGLRGQSVIHNQDDRAVQCELFVSLRRTYETTFCCITYRLNDDSETQIIELEWPTQPDSRAILKISFNTTESCLWVFKRNRTEEFVFEVEDTPSYYWCYFPDIRNHLYRISP